jgi:threonyl-tRNA synthetase
MFCGWIPTLIWNRKKWPCLTVKSKNQLKKMQITLTLPDNSKREYNKGVTGAEVAKDISPALYKAALGIKINGEVCDLQRPIESDARIAILTWDNPDGQMVYWHSTAHLMAEALEYFYPDIKLAIGPPIDQGFYYDVDLEDKSISNEDFEKIEAKIKELAAQKNPFVREEKSKNEAKAFYRERNNTYKLELIEDLQDGEITFYHQGNFTDLCKGPHLPHTGYIKAVKLLNVAGAYWRGDEKNKQLTRIYGISFPKQKMLADHLEMLEEARKRDHRRLGKKLGLFTFSPKVGQGLPLWLPKGTEVRDRLENFLKTEQLRRGYKPVITPHIGRKELYITSGHYEKYGKDSFQPISTPNEGEEYMLKPMNCPHHCEIFNSEPLSYRDLPLRLAEFGTVYRYEQSGELNGLARARCFTVDDSHIFCRPDQVKDEFLGVIDLVMLVFSKLGFENFTAQISLRDPDDPDKYIGSNENWERAEQAIIESAQEKNLKTVTEYGEAAFYGPKLDFMVRDALNRPWQLGTIQVDYNLPERFQLEYTGSDDQKHRPVMIHRAPFGSMERFIAILLEHTNGNLPLWLAPVQVSVLPVSEKVNNYAEKVCSFLNNAEIRTSFDDRNEKIGRKIRDAETSKTPYMLIVGEKESASEKVSVRKHREGDMGVMSLSAFQELINEELNN